MQGHMHHKRRLLIALVATGGFSVGLASFAVTANAAQRTFVVTVVGNIKKTVTVDVGAGRAARSDQAAVDPRLADPRHHGDHAGGACRPGRSGRHRAGRHRRSVRRARRSPGRRSPRRSGRPARRSAFHAPASARSTRPATSSKARSRRCSVPAREDEAALPERRSDAAEPDHVPGIPGPGGGRRSELLHRQVPHPRLPAPDLPGRRHPVRRAVGGPRRDQRDRDELRAQPQRVQRRRGRLDAVHPVELEDVRRRRQRRRQEGPVQPGRRDLRRGALPQGRRRAGRSAQGDLRLQPRRLVRQLGAHARTLHRRDAG